jgi:programmed cell death 6-interacting protein
MWRWLRRPTDARLAYPFSFFIFRAQAAQTSLVAAKKEAKHASRDLQDTVAATEAAVFDRLQRAERENATVYLQRVPSAADLPPIAPAPLVKPLPPRGLAPDEEAARMFAAVVPDTSAKALSKYSALVDALARRQLDALEAASDEARLRLREWELPESLAALDPGGGGAALPHGARLELDKVAAAGGAAHLRGLAAQIRELRVVTAAEVDAAEAELDAEAREDGELAAHYGPRWRRPPSAQLTTTLRSRVAGYRANLEAAAASDARLEAELAAGAAAFAALDPDAAAAAMPRLQSPMLSVDDMEPAAAAATLRGALEGLGTLSSQRAALEEALKARKGADNILPRLLAAPAADVDALFASELRKYDDLVAAVADNTAKQAQLLQAAAVAQAQFRRGYGFEEWRRACERAAAGLRTTAAAFLQLGGSLAEGLRFYASLQDAVGALRRLVGDHVAARRVQRDEMVDALRAAAAAQEAAAAQQLAGMSLAGQQGGYGGQPPPHPPPPPPPPQPQQQQYYAPQQQAGYHQPPPPPPSHAQWPPPAYAPPPPPQQQQQQQYQPQYQQQPQQQQQQAGGYGGGYAPTGPPPPQAPPPPPPPQQGGSLAGFLGFGR